MGRALTPLADHGDYLLRVLLGGFETTARIYDRFGHVDEAAALSAFHDALRDEFDDELVTRHLSLRDITPTANSQTRTHP